MTKRKRRIDKKIHVKYIGKVFREVCEEQSWRKTLCSSKLGEEFDINTNRAIVFSGATRSIIIKYNLEYVVSKNKVSNKGAVIKIWPKYHESVKRSFEIST